VTFPPPEWTVEDRAAHEQRNARIDVLLQERLARYRSTNVKVFDMFIDPDDDSAGEPNLWVACDHDTGEVIQRLARDELEPFYIQHSDWVEYTSLLDEIQELVSEERG
jgi:hypothetical protein